jgi:D-alanyl-D-alanine carboxypeptidase/D-alanyl-D-alanine-endopeptidase (penicillin-binding protein 4)
MLMQSCSVSRQISKQAQTILLNDSSVGNGHIGISIYDPAANTYLYNYNDTKYFIPASNTKLFTLYAGMKYLGDSLVGIYYQNYSTTSINILPTGDPTFLHPDFPNQPVLDFLKQQQKDIYIANNFRDSALGKGWAWDDYNDSYMVERNAMPVYGNTVRFKLNDIKFTSNYSGDLEWDIVPKLFKDSIAAYYVLPYLLRARKEMQDSFLSKKKLFDFSIERNRVGNIFTIKGLDSKFTEQKIPFCVNGINTVKQILKNDFNLKIKEGWQSDDEYLYPVIPPHLAWHPIKSQPIDSLLKPMMHNSDNFFAEQTLLMVCRRKFWHNTFMSTDSIINTLLSTDLKDIPQPPRWVDGSGLSRYNLFTPQSFIYILNKLQQEFGMKRLKVILPTGSEGTLKNYFNADSGFIYAKTGSMSNQFTLCGYLTTKKNRQLIFSVLVNNEMANSRDVRRAVERFIKAIRNKF